LIWRKGYGTRKADDSKSKPKTIETSETKHGVLETGKQAFFKHFRGENKL